MGRWDGATTDERFDAKWRLDERTGCHLWHAARDTFGYGNFWTGHSYVKAHGFAWSRKHGPVPAGMHLDHFVCSNPQCCNPDHLKVVTPRENVLRAEAGPSAVNARKAECVNGHPFTPENTYSRPDGRGKDCRLCRRMRAVAHPRPTTVTGRKALRDRNAALRALRNSA